MPNNIFFGGKGPRVPKLKTFCKLSVDTTPQLDLPKNEPYRSYSLLSHSTEDAFWVLVTIFESRRGFYTRPDNFKTSLNRPSTFKSKLSDITIITAETQSWNDFDSEIESWNDFDIAHTEITGPIFINNELEGITPPDDVSFENGFWVSSMIEALTAPTDHNQVVLKMKTFNYHDDESTLFFNLF
ncbi:hypothetical protein NEOLI_001733 [Neolecta irregularis DAH-3]|uniref:Uncharacterized protein n=1 Tax=Neolecta irregularis (strain DAH-3) TaxID=1198029 RepID=A0A1U7LVR3_NEOID|nr:hypothetical protein NEOLI_001733 [Neolecta irregularis DAH-3]|eukprot:OLL26765.1 hypothetical protein NEOLI_001733 [Neolecta irregularis DAH-3]